jgi:hypothetical protein
MTMARLLRLLIRRWYVVVAGVACTWLACTALMLTPPVYAAQMDVVFVVPGGVASSRADDAFAEPLINFASIVAVRVHAVRPSVKLSSPTAALYGLGVREGVSVSLADAGGQWESVFNRPVIRIQAVDSSPERVASVIDEVVVDIASAATSIQDESGVGKGARIGIETVPQKAEVFTYSRTRTSEAKATAAAALLGLSLTACAAALSDRWARPRRRRSERTGHGAKALTAQSETTV